MTLQLVPYNDSMRLGQGINSYTQALCIDKAIVINKSEVKSSNTPAQTVSYSSRNVSKLSDIVDSLNISFSNAIKKGTVEINGNTSKVDETTFKESDVTFMVSVKVTNQTTSISEDCKFQDIEDLTPGTNRFNDVYGDCFISGFIEGGDLTGIVSMKALDKNKSAKKITQIKDALNSTSTNELVLDSLNAPGSTFASNVTKDTECTVSVNWMGGGQIKDENTLWNIDSLYAAAAAFPSRVAECPQRTWAILTKYKANRSFIEKYSKLSLYKTLQYDQISTFTAELFDSFMDYKLLLKALQNIIQHRDAYEAKLVVNAIDTTLPTLLSVKSALRKEQSKIVDAIDILGRNPDILKREAHGFQLRESPTVARIIEAAMGSRAKAPGQLEMRKGSPEGDMPAGVSERKNITTLSSSETSDGALTTSTPDTSEQGLGATKIESFDFESLIPSEVWADLMPEPKKELAHNPLLNIGLGPSSSTLTVPNGALSLSYDAMRRELDQEKAAAKTATDTADRAQADVSKLENELKALREKYAKDKENADLLLRQASQDLAAEKEAATAAKTKADQDIASVKEALKSSKTETATVKAESNKYWQAWDAAKANLAEITNPAIYKRNRVEIFSVVYASKHISNDAEMGRKLLDYAHNKEPFEFSDGGGRIFGGHNAMPEAKKSGSIVYRLDGRGPLRVLAAKQWDQAKFDDW